jgi:hypothetical protein
MPNHLSIEVLGVLRGTADGPVAVGVLGLMALVALSAFLRRRPLKRLRSTIQRNVQQKSRPENAAARNTNATCSR